MLKTICFAAGLVAVTLAPLPARAAMLDEYHAYIGQDDLYNSRGVRLTEPWQIIRQDRANFFRYGIRQRGDEPDSFFASIRNRAAAEQMLRRGSIDRRAEAMIVEGDVMIRVRVFGHGGVGDYIEVSVAR